jgi:hypothetical protein
MLKFIDADKHNFGQSVKLMERASGVYYQKPRPVYWEKLFFGKTSSLAELFNAVGENGNAPISKYLFNLEVEIESEWLGFAKDVRRSTSTAVTTEHFYGFGVLLAYAYVFGIRDLHTNNLILTDTHLQAIDAEIVLTDLVLPHETILLPFKDVEFDRCGASKLATAMDEFSKDGRREILAGYLDAFAIFFRKQIEIQQTLETSLLTTPARVIVRNTREYRPYLNGSAPLDDLLPEERIQIERGDVPYFFKICGDQNLYWLSESNGAKSIVSDLGDYAPDIARHAQSPEKIIGTPSVIERKMVQGAFLLKKLFHDNAAYEFAWNGKQILIEENGLENHATGHAFRNKSKS